MQTTIIGQTSPSTTAGLTLDRAKSGLATRQIKETASWRDASTVRRVAVHRSAPPRSIIGERDGRDGSRPLPGLTAREERINSGPVSTHNPHGHVASKQHDSEDGW